MAELDMLRLDVFTEDLYGGNPAWVVFDADALDEVQMQRIAIELGPPETAFVLKSKKADLRLRYFSQLSEDPISGHATVGALWALANREAFGMSRAGRHRLETPLGILPFSFDEDREGRMRVWMTQKRPLFAKVEEFKEVASALGIGAESLFREEFPISRSSTGIPSLLVPVRSLEILRRIEPKRDEVAELARELDVGAIFVYTWGVFEPGSTVHARCFGPPPSFPEDTASGMPAGALGAFLVENDLIPREKNESIVVEQGHIMGRPSKIQVRVEKKGATIRKVEVGGYVTASARGRVVVP